MSLNLGSRLGGDPGQHSGRGEARWNLLVEDSEKQRHPRRQGLVHPMFVTQRISTQNKMSDPNGAVPLRVLMSDHLVSLGVHCSIMSLISLAFIANTTRFNNSYSSRCVQLTVLGAIILKGSSNLTRALKLQAAHALARLPGSAVPT